MSGEPVEDDRYFLPADPWSRHPTWVAKLDEVAEVVDWFETAMARRGLNRHECRRAAIICAAVLVPTDDGSYRLREFPVDWPPIAP